jgi:cytochrome P450
MWAFAMPRKRLRQELEVLENFIAPYIDQALQLSSEELEQVTQSDTDYTFLHALAAHTRDRKVLRDQIVSMLLAGRDTTACTLSWLFYELSVHPHVVDKLRKEILQQVGPTRAPTYADLKNMRYLQVHSAL